ncbi:hypothetical protein KIH74_11115 [Kineosporia sp. J2-2]|uniref:O-antigen ligase n=1 Tax=Kineosporia corallincola TaxID=2835133 RepID=A0ABS5TEF6_9ACTN|nr:hypothetical protein [Kineosporia corallincola]MBT0769473.1 hypothetical protein [Kineosporia corallincola]
MEPPTTADKAIRIVTVGTAVVGLPSPTTWNPLPLSIASLFYVLLLGIIVVGLLGPRVAYAQPYARGTFFLTASAYVTVKTVSLLLGATPASMADFIQAYKAYFFLVILTWFIGRGCFTLPALATTVRALLVITLLKYSVCMVAGGPRPAIWTENNFELMAIMGLTYLAFPALGARKSAWVGVLCLIVALSESRCSIIELGVCLLAIYFRPSSKTFAVRAVLLAAAGFLGDRVFTARMEAGGGGLNSTDRFQFWKIFVTESQSWSLREWLLGTPPLTPLSSGSCERLTSWSGLFSKSGVGDVCYSVALHMFALRAVIDQGILGLTFLLVFLWLGLRVSGASLRDRLALMGIGVANALSVSSFNSEYMLLPLAVAMGLQRRSVEAGERLSEAPARTRRAAELGELTT